MVDKETLWKALVIAHEELNETTEQLKKYKTIISNLKENIEGDIIANKEALKNLEVVLGMGVEEFGVKEILK